MPKTLLQTRGAYRRDEAARWLGMSLATLERLIARNEIRSFKVGSARFISAAELERFVREREAKA